jgi:acrylyl-CoA reductase (NADPH)/3-hydroxypropionyl-CoA dehydratase/3-hydroxypropionyl-CoA synthetase
MQVLKDLGLSKGDRIAFNLPNIPEQVFYMLAAQRMGVVYTPVFGGFSAKTLSDRIHDAGAKLVITADGGYRNAEVVAYKGTYTDPALDNYIPRDTALQTLQTVLATYDLGALAETLYNDVHEALAGEITLERSDLMRELGASIAKAKCTPRRDDSGTANGRRTPACRCEARHRQRDCRRLHRARDCGACSG